MKAPVFLVIHMCLTVKARESVGRRAKLVIRPEKFATHKKTHGFEYKLSLRCNIQKSFGLKINEFCFKLIIGCNSQMMRFITL